MINNLQDTVPFMTSDNYKERFVGEYWQTKIRYEKLKSFNTKIEASDMSVTVPAPEHDCPLCLLKAQQKAMGEYLHTLEIRAVIEGIDLYKV